MLASAFYRSINRSGLTTFARYAQAGGAILCYHNNVPSSSAGGAPGMHLDVQRFREQIDWLVRHFTVISLGEYARRLQLGRSLRRVAAITCDDGYRGVFDLAWPILREHRLPLTVFVPTGLPDSDGFWWDAPAVVDCTTMRERQRWITDFNGDVARIGRLIPGAIDAVPPMQRMATWARIAEAVRDGCELGVHTRTHCNLTAVSDAQLRDELSGGQEEIARRTGASATCFAYPYGLFDTRARAAVQYAGYRTAVTLQFGLNAAGAAPLTLRRINIPASISPMAFEAWMSGLRPRIGAST
jgi:peptidoglycan/xylan/chitin deacetylase (PgdA/CDA1 family)